MVCLVLNGKKEQLKNSAALVEKLAAIPGMTSIIVNTNKEKTNRILGAACETLWGRDYIEDYIGDVRYQIGPLSFFQVNPAQTKVLYSKALEYADLKGQEIVWDLYCGIGTISLFLAQKASQVCGVEIVREAIDDARRNAASTRWTTSHFLWERRKRLYLPSTGALASVRTSSSSTRREKAATKRSFIR